VLPYRERSTRLAIRNEISDLAILRGELKRFCEEHAIARKTLMQLQVTLDEIVSNIIKYAWPEGGTHELSVRITVSENEIEIEVVDDGQAFDPRTAPAPDRRTARRRPRPGGIGIHMVKQLVDDIAYSRVNGRNHIVLTKRRSAGKASHGN
jgi:serine/threonine-protein kinase RsbW